MEWRLRTETQRLKDTHKMTTMMRDAQRVRCGDTWGGTDMIYIYVEQLTYFDFNGDDATTTTNYTFFIIIATFVAFHILVKQTYFSDIFLLCIVLKIFRTAI